MRCASRTKKTWLSIGSVAVGFLPLAARIVQKHQIEIRTVAELDAAELAVAGGGDLHTRRPAPSPQPGVPN